MAQDRSPGDLSQRQQGVQNLVREREIQINEKAHHAHHHGGHPGGIFLCGRSQGDSPGTTADYRFEKSGKANAWYALSGTKKLTEVQFLETIGDTEYLEQARAHEKKYYEDAGTSAFVFLGSVASGGVGLILVVAATATKKPELMTGGLIAGLAAIPRSVRSAVAKPRELNLLSADQAQVLADRYNGKL